MNDADDGGRSHADSGGEGDDAANDCSHVRSSLKDVFSLPVAEGQQPNSCD